MDTKIRQLGKTISAQTVTDGAGVKLQRSLSPAHYRLFDPFLMLDEFVSEEAADYLAGFPEHPHRGFETVTYLLQGAMRHQDHLGNTGHLRAGDVQWMSAGRGIIHSEMPEQENGKLHGFQLWVNLPASEKFNAPRYQDFTAADFPVIRLAEGSQLKLLAGSFTDSLGNTYEGAITGIHTRPLLFDAVLVPGQHLAVPVPPEQTVLVYVYQGAAEIGTDRQYLRASQAGQLVDGGQLLLSAGTDGVSLLLLAAQPIGEPAVQSGPFVMNTAEEIEQAFRDYREGVLTQA